MGKDKLVSELFKQINTIHLDHSKHFLHESFGLLEKERENMRSFINANKKNQDKASQTIETIWNSDKHGLYERIWGVWYLGYCKGRAEVGKQD